MTSKNKSSNLLMKFLRLKRPLARLSPTTRDDRNRHDDGAAKGSRSVEVSSQDIQFYSDMYDDLNSFRHTALKKLQMIEEKLRSIETRIEELANAIHAYEMYSYHYNLKIVGLPQSPSPVICKFTRRITYRMILLIIW